MAFPFTVYFKHIRFIHEILSNIASFLYFCFDRPEIKGNLQKQVLQTVQMCNTTMGKRIVEGGFCIKCISVTLDP